MKLRKSTLLVGLSIAIGAAIALVLILEPLQWRVQLLALKARGGVDEVSWGELISMLTPGSGYWLQPAVTEGRGLHAVINNPHDSQADVQAGQIIFRERSSACHVVGITRGESDYSLYQVVRDGVPGTAMLPAGLPEMKTWQTIAFIRDRQSAGRAQWE